jgi:hypothetical protein
MALDCAWPIDIRLWLQAGLSQDDVKIVILQNLLPKEDYAAVAARVNGSG